MPRADGKLTRGSLLVGIRHRAAASLLVVKTFLERVTRPIIQYEMQGQFHTNLSRSCSSNLQSRSACIGSAQPSMILHAHMQVDTFLFSAPRYQHLPDLTNLASVTHLKKSWSNRGVGHMAKIVGNCTYGYIVIDLCVMRMNVLPHWGSF